LFVYRKQARLIAKEQERSIKWARMAKQYTSEANEIEYSFSDHHKVNTRSSAKEKWAEKKTKKRRKVLPPIASAYAKIAGVTTLHMQVAD
jgi:transposase